MTEEPPPTAGTFAARLNHLIEHAHPPDRGRYSNEEIAEAVGVSSQAVRYWRQSKRVDPKIGSIQRLADFFGVPAAYFFDDTVAEQFESELELVMALRDLGVRQVALRAAGLSAAGRKTLVELLNHIRQLEGLPVHHTDADPGLS